jgi:hypothetical protein
VPPGELIELRPQQPVKYSAGGSDFTKNPDGSELVSLFGADNRQDGDPDWKGMAMGGNPQGAFSENLADNMSPSQRHRLAQILCEYERVDLDSRKDWEDMLNSSMTLLGLTKIDMSRLPFVGAAAMQHPILAECVTQFNSNAIQEFFPPTGPVKGDPQGDVTDDLEDMAERAANYMNYYLTVEDVGYYADKDQMLFYLPIAGSAFVKAWLDPRSQLPQARYVKSQDFIAPYFAKDLENCPRYAHRYELEGHEIRKGMQNGEYVDLNLPRPGMLEENAEESMEDIADRRTRQLHQDDELFAILEYHVDLSLDPGLDDIADALDTDMPLPYIAVVDKTSNELLALRRNWRQNDPKMKKRIWFAHYKFLPGLGFYGWGFMHIIGALAEAISGSGRAILDSALLATVSGGFRAKDGAKKVGSIAVEPGKWKDIDASMDELAKTFYTPPVKEPSPALTQFFTAMVADARRFASLTEVLVGQADNKAPVGTTLALIEQSMKLFTAIHKRIFAAAREEFRMLRELIHDYSPDKQYPYQLQGKAQMALKTDFGDSTSFVPVADPNIISDIQRISLAQAILELTEKSPDLYGPEQKIEAHIRFLKALKVPDWQKIAPSMPKPTYMDPIGENQMMMVGRPVRAYPGQKHDSHNMIHQWQIEQARNTLPPDQFQHIYLTIASHMREHQALMMSEQVSAQMKQGHGVPLPPIDIYGPNKDEDPHVEMAISIIAAGMLPPISPPMPGSAAAMANGQQAPDPTMQAQQDIQASQAKIQAAIQAKKQESGAKIERDTQQFVAQYHQNDQDHAQKLRHMEDEHRAKMHQIDQETAASILRQHAEHRQQQSQQRVTHLSALSHGRDTHEQTLKQGRRSANESLLATRQKRRASPGARKSPTRKVA